MFIFHSQEANLEKKIISQLEKLKDRRGFLNAGLPRFGRLFGRDSLISAWQLLDFDPGIAKATLEILSQYQGKVVDKEREEEPGKIIHETDFKSKRHFLAFFPFPYYGSVDSTPLFLILFSLYFKKTRDEKFLNEHWENVLKALNWITEYGDKDKDLFLEYQKLSSNGLFHQGWKDSFANHLNIEPPVAIVEVQGYQYLALKEIANIAQEKKASFLADQLKERAEKLKEKFNHFFWMEDLKYFALALNGRKEQKKSITSNPGHLLFCEIIDENRIELVVNRLFAEDLWTEFGIRTHSKNEPDFNPRSYHLGSIWPHDNWIIAQGLKKLGFQKEYEKIKKAIFKTYHKLKNLPEYYTLIDGKITEKLSQPPCYLQAWSLGALFNFLQDF